MGCCATVPHDVIVLVCRSSSATMPMLVMAETTSSTSDIYVGLYWHDVLSQNASLRGMRMMLAPHDFACASSSWPGVSPEPSMPTREKPRKTTGRPRASRTRLPEGVSGPMRFAELPEAVVSVTSSMTCVSPAAVPGMLTTAVTYAVDGGAIATARGVRTHVDVLSVTVWPTALPTTLPALSAK